MKLITETWPSIQEIYEINEHTKYPENEKEWRDFIDKLSKDNLKFKEHVNRTVLRLNDWAYKVRSSVNRINPRYQLQGDVITVTISVADTETSVAHGLNYTPTYWQVLDTNIPGYFCRSKAFDGTNVYFKAGDTGTATVAVW